MQESARLSHIWPILIANLLISLPLASRQGFNRQNKTNGNGNNQGQQKAPTPQNSSPTAYTPPAPPATSTSSVSTPGASQESPSNSDNQQQQIQQMQPQMEPEPVKFFFREKYARLGVKGNFMPLAAQPKNVDLGEWLAHQGTPPYYPVRLPLSNTVLPHTNSCRTIPNSRSPDSLHPRSRRLHRPRNLQP